MSKAKRLVVISDTQLPFEDKRALKAVINFIGEYQPDEVIHIGDLIDMPQPSRWSKDTRAEFEGSVFRDADYTKRSFLKPLRDVYSGPVGVHEGNHDERPRVYLAKYAPALAESKAFDFDVLLDFDGFGVTRLPDFYRFAPGWITTHGHKAGIRLTNIAGNTALNAAKRMGVSVIMGHTHRLGRGAFSEGYDNRVTRTVVGMEVGNLMDMTKAGYLKGAAANWQQGFGIVHVDGSTVQATPISIANRKFVVDGVSYAV